MSSFSIEGMDELQAKLEKLADTQKLEGAFGKACALVERAAKKGAPANSGELRRSITSRVDNNGDSLEGVVYTSLFYAPYVEYGTGLFAENGGRQAVPWAYQDEKGVWHQTSGMHPQPYMRPALENNVNNVIEILKEGFSID